MIGALLRIPFQHVTERVYAALDSAGFSDISPAHFAVFQHLPPDGARQSVLAERAKMRKQSMGYLVRHLESCGYLERVADPDDKRAQLVRQTARGREVERIARRAIAGVEHEWLELLGPVRFSVFRRTLETISAHAEAREA